jgi:hypothetical protein
VSHAGEAEPFVEHCGTLNVIDPEPYPAGSFTVHGAARREEGWEAGL